MMKKVAIGLGVGALLPLADVGIAAAMGKPANSIGMILETLLGIGMLGSSGVTWFISTRGGDDDTVTPTRPKHISLQGCLDAVILLTTSGLLLDEHEAQLGEMTKHLIYENANACKAEADEEE